MSIRVKWVINPGFEKYVAQSYGDFGFGKFGVCQFIYDDYRGPIHFINTVDGMIEAEYDSPEAFKYWLVPNISGVFSPYIHIKNRIDDVIINGIASNLLTGAGIAALLALL